jgi:Flp pilus assembly protein TadD
MIRALMRPQLSDGLICALLLLAVGLIYAPVIGHGYVYDDAVYITENMALRSGIDAHSVTWAFTTFHASNWHPVTWLSHLLDAELFGASPAGPHGVNVVLHGINALLVFLFFRRTTGSTLPSAVAAGLFALHPLRVESVAWIAERKDLLAALFGLIALHAYVSYARRGTAARYAVVVIAFALGLLAKPMLVTLPFLMLLLDRWPLQRATRWPRLLSEKLPLLLLAIASSVVTIVAQRAGGAVRDLEAFPLGARLGNAALAYVGYLWKTLWPDPLAVLYPHPGTIEPFGAVAAGLGVIAAAVVCLLAVRKQPAVTVGGLWFFGALVPVIGIVQVGVQSMADRYTYIPSIGLSILLCWGLPGLFVGYRRTLMALAAIALIMCAVQARRQVSVWRNSETLFSHALVVTEGNYVAHYNLGNALRRDGRLEDAAAHYEAALELLPSYEEARMNLALIRSTTGDGAEIEALLERTVAASPDDAKAHANLGVLRARRGQMEEAARLFRRAVELRPGDASILQNLCSALILIGRADEALALTRDAIAAGPTDELYVVQGRVQFATGQPEAAAQSFREALGINPRNAQASRALAEIDGTRPD